MGEVEPEQLLLPRASSALTHEGELQRLQRFAQLEACGAEQLDVVAGAQVPLQQARLRGAHRPQLLAATLVSPLLDELAQARAETLR